MVYYGECFSNSVTARFVTSAAASWSAKKWLWGLEAGADSEVSSKGAGEVSESGVTATAAEGGLKKLSSQDINWRR
jgi:hypothetical protein